jgi:hypothetical protein
MDIVMPAGAERCPACRTPMLPDQRYCLECGERRSEPRRLVAAAAPLSPAPAPRSRAATPASATLIAGVATLLVALGVGVEIGRGTGKPATPVSAAPVRVVTIGGTGAAAPAATAAASATPTAAPEDAGKPDDAKKAKPTPTPKPAKTPPPEVKVGSPGKGAGYKDGKFTGDFFGQ